MAELWSKDRFAGLSGTMGFRGGFRGAPRGGGGFRGGLRGGGLGGRGGFRGGGFGGGGAGRDFSNQDLYADYNGPDSSGGANGPGGGALRMDQYGGGGGGGGYGGGGYGGYEPEPSQQIMVRNVCIFLEWEKVSVADECLVALVDCERGFSRVV